MNKFTKGTLLFIAINSIILSCFELIIRQVPHDLSFKRDLLEKEDFDVVVSGSSYTYYGINPEQIRKFKGINIAYPMQNIEYPLQLYTNNIGKLKGKVVAVEFSYFMAPFFQSTASKAKNFYLYSHYWGCDIPHAYSLLYNNSLLMTLTPSNSLEKINRYYLHNEYLRCNNWGYEINYDKVDLEEDAKKIAVMHNGYWQEDEYREKLNEHLEMLKEFFNLTQKTGVKVVLFNTPLSKQYHEIVDKKYYDSYISSVVEITKEHNIEFLDYCFDKNYTSDDFADSDHLNEEGALKFTKQFESDLIKLIQAN